MSDTEPIVTVDGRRAMAAVADRTAWAASVVVAVVVGVGALVTGVAQSLVGGPLAVALGVGFATLCVLIGVSALRDTTAVRFYRDRVVTETRAGPFGESEAVPYEDIDLVVREDESEETRGGTGAEVGTFELLRSGDDPVALRHVRDPATVERIFEGRVPAPSEREELASEDSEGFDRAIEHERTLWRRWPSDRPLRDSAVVAAAGPTAALDGRVDVRSRSAGRRRGGNTVTGATVEELARGQRPNSHTVSAHDDPSDPGSLHSSKGGSMGMAGDGGDGGEM